MQKKLFVWERQYSYYLFRSYKIDANLFIWTDVYGGGGWGVGSSLQMYVFQTLDKFNASSNSIR